MEEILDIIDEQNHVIGQAPKDEVHRRGLRHRVGAVLLRREDGRYLIPTASDIKAEAGRLFHSAAGHVLSGESYVASALRELKEETGIVADHIEPMGDFWFEEEYKDRHEIERFEVYEALYRKAMGPILLNEEQVNEQWLSREALASLYHHHPRRISGPLQKTCRLILRL